MKELSPQERLTVQNYDDLAEAWAADRNTKNFWAPEIERFHELLPSGTVLEIGSGHGRDAAELIDLGYDYVGTDISAGLLKLIKARFPDQKFYQQSIYDLSFPDGPEFDAFWAAAVLLHIPKERIDEALRSIKRVIKARALGFISLKDGQGEGVRQDEIGGKTMERFFSYWSREDFTKTLENNGFSVVDYIYRPMSESTKWHSFFVRSDS